MSSDEASKSGRRTPETAGRSGDESSGRMPPARRTALLESSSEAKVDLRTVVRLLEEQELARCRGLGKPLWDVILGRPPDGRGGISGWVDVGKTGMLTSTVPRQFVITLRDGTIIGRGLAGEGPEKDLPGSDWKGVWRRWDVAWADGRLRCLRCNHEWVPSGSLPEQCPKCLGEHRDPSTIEAAREGGAARIDKNQ